MTGSGLGCVKTQRSLMAIEGVIRPRPLSGEMASLVERAVSARLAKKALPQFKYRDFGTLVNLSEYGTVGNLIGFVGKRSVYLEGVFARLVYRSLYKMHQRALHGTLKTAPDTAANLILRHTEPRVKLH
jgi:NADH:ubiquinone reductase (H+-translocating)